METTLMGCIGASMRRHSFVPSKPMVSFECWSARRDCLNHCATEIPRSSSFLQEMG